MIATFKNYNTKTDPIHSIILIFRSKCLFLMIRRNPLTLYSKIMLFVVFAFMLLNIILFYSLKIPDLKADEAKARVVYDFNNDFSEEVSQLNGLMDSIYIEGNNKACLASLYHSKLVNLQQKLPLNNNDSNCKIYPMLLQSSLKRFELNEQQRKTQQEIEIRQSNLQESYRQLIKLLAIKHNTEK